jgi:hypothetical protein
MFVIFVNFTEIKGFIFDSTTTTAAHVGNHGNSPNTWETMVMARIQYLESRSSTCESGVATLNSEVNVLVHELVKVNATANDNRK